jgi:hypothetical protein
MHPDVGVDVGGAEVEGPGLLKWGLEDGWGMVGEVA